MQRSFSMFFRRVLFCLVPALAASIIPAAHATTPEEEKKLESVRGMFSSPYTEEMYYRTDRLLFTATKHLVEARKAPAIATVITGEEIRQMGARNLLDVLRRVPGIGVSVSSIPFKTAIEVRGVKTLHSEKVLVMIDGHTINNNYNGAASNFFDDLMVENIKRVEVVRGPGSALYGANAFVAVINVVTLEADEIGGIQIGAGVGSFETQHYNLLAGRDVGDLQVSGNLDYLKTDGSEHLIESDGQSPNPWSVAPGYTDERLEQVDLGFNARYGDFTIRSRFIDKEKGPYIGAANALNDESLQEYQLFFADAIYAKQLSKELDITVKLFANYFNMNLYWELFPEGAGGGAYPDGLIGNPSVKNSIIGTDVAVDYLWNDHVVTAGAVAERITQYDVEHWANFNPNDFKPLPEGFQDITSRWNHNRNTDRDVLALYLQDVWEITPADSLTLGVRHDNYSDFGGTTNPRIGFVHELANNATVKMLFGTAFRAPTFSELYADNNPAAIGNNDLDPEKINTYEVGYELPFMENQTFGLNIFQNDIHDLINVDPATHKYSNRDGTTTIRGGEAELVLRLAQNSSGFASLGYQDSEDESGESLPDVSHWKAALGWNQGVTRFLNANMEVLWTGERPRVPQDTREDLDASTLVSLTLIAKSFFRTLEIRGMVHNLLNEDYRDPSSFDVARNRAPIPGDFPSNSRSYLLEARYAF